MRQKQPLILASQSMARRRLLKDAGLDFTCQSSGVDEAQAKKDFYGLAHREMVRALAKYKALSVARDNPDAYVIAADQIAVFKGRILDKPDCRARAIARLTDMRGHEHVLMTATVFYQGERCLFSSVDEACLTLKQLNNGEIKKYVDFDKPYDSVGAYKIEGIGRDLFARIEGDRDVIMGISVKPLLDLIIEK